MSIIESLCITYVRDNLLFFYFFLLNSDSRSEEQSQLQLVEREEIEDEEDLFEAIDKRTRTFLARLNLLRIMTVICAFDFDFYWMF